MRLFLDDIRDPRRLYFVQEGHRVEYLWTWAHTAEQAIELLKTGEVTFASLDHDLAPEHYESERHCGQGCGCVVIDWMAENNVWPVDGVRVHSQNPAGAARMRQAIDAHYGEGYSKWQAMTLLQNFMY